MASIEGDIHGTDGHETLSQDRTGERGSNGLLSIVWVYPERRFTPLGHGTITLGRDRTSSVCLDLRSVSRHHARIRAIGAIHVLSDEQSHNGTRHNGVPVSQALLADHDVVRIGDAVGVVAYLNAVVIESGTLFSEPAPGIVIGPRLASSWRSAEQIAKSSLALVLEGPTGSGKEVFARLVHALSGRAGAFVAQNCAALPESLVEAQLFGHARGAFTGAHTASPGLFAAADGGTLLLDEVLDLPLPQQAKLLRVLDERMVTPLGSTKPRSVDVRVVTAAQRPLRIGVDAGTFRADLFARLAGTTLRLPPLRERREEIFGMFANFLREFGADPSQLSASFVEALCLHDWPFNVRQLRQAAQSLSVQFEGVRNIGRSHFEHLMLSFGVRTSGPVAQPARASQTRVESARALSRESALGARRSAWLERHRVELEALRRALSATNGNVSLAARSIRISRQQAQRLLAADEKLAADGDGRARD